MPYDSGMIFGGGTADDAGDIGVSLDNLGELDRVLASAAQRREAHLYELAYSLVRSLPEPSLGALSESYRETAQRLTASLCGSASELFPPRSLRDGVNPIGAPELLGIYDRVTLVRGLYGALGERGLAAVCPGRAARRVYIAHRAWCAYAICRTAIPTLPQSSLPHISAPRRTALRACTAAARSRRAERWSRARLSTASSR